MPELTTGQALNKALSLILEQNPTAFIAGEDIGIYGGAFGVTDGLLAQYGEERIKDTPIAEDVIAGLAVGASMTGGKPIVEMQFSDFIVNAMDPIVNQAAKLHFMYGGSVNVPIIVRGASGAGTGAAAQHSQSLESWFCHVPGLKVVTPSNPQNAYDLLLHSFVDPNPVIFMEHKLIYKIKDNVELNDIPAFLGHLGVGVSSEAFGDMIVDQFDVLYEEGATNARCMPICLHTFHVGQPNKFKHLKRAFEYIASHDDVILSTGDDINDWYREQYM